MEGSQPHKGFIVESLASTLLGLTESLPHIRTSFTPYPFHQSSLSSTDIFSLPQTYHGLRQNKEFGSYEGLDNSDFGTPSPHTPKKRTQEYASLPTEQPAKRIKSNPIATSRRPSERPHQSRITTLPKDQLKESETENEGHNDASTLTSPDGALGVDGRRGTHNSCQSFHTNTIPCVSQNCIITNPEPVACGATPHSNHQVQSIDSIYRPSNRSNILKLKLPSGGWQNANLHHVTNSQRDDVESLCDVKIIQHSSKPVAQLAESQDNVLIAADVLPGILLEDSSSQFQPQSPENTTKEQYSVTVTKNAANHFQTNTVSTSARVTNSNADITADDSTMISMAEDQARVDQSMYRPSPEASASAKITKSPLDKTSVTSSPALYQLSSPDQLVSSIPEPVMQLSPATQLPAIILDSFNHTSNSLISTLAPHDLDTNQKSLEYNARNTATSPYQPLETPSTPNPSSSRATSERNGNNPKSNQAQLLPYPQSRFKPFMAKYFVTSRESGTEVEWAGCRMKGTSLTDFVAGISKITNNSDIEGFVMELKSQRVGSPIIHLVVVGQEERWRATRARLLKDMIEGRESLYEILVKPIYGIERSEQYDDIWLENFDELNY